MKILVDTNVVLDVLLNRPPHSRDSTAVLALVEIGRVQGLLCATTITTIDYLLTQSMKAAEARACMAKLIRLCDIAPVNRAVIEAAMQSRIADFEDAVLDESAAFAGANAIVTRNTRDFVKATTRVMDPREFVVQFGG